LGKRKIYRLCWRSNPDSSVVQSLYLLSYSDSLKTRNTSKKENVIIRFRTVLKVEKNGLNEAAAALCGRGGEGGHNVADSFIIVKKFN
jgi:hypothetical protein